MRKNLKRKLYVLILLIFIFFPIHNAYAKTKPLEYRFGEVKYNDNSNESDDDMEYYDVKSSNTFEINIDRRYKVHIELVPDDFYFDQNGYVTLSILQDEISKAFYDDIHISSKTCKNNVIDIELDPGTYQLQVGALSGGDDYVKYEMHIEYTSIISRADFVNDNATISFKSKSYKLTMDSEYSYDFGSYDFFKNVTIDSDQEYESIVVSWKSSNKKIASVDKEGCVTAHAPGIITLTATLPNGNKDSCEITVPKPTYKISKIKSTIYTGNSVQLSIVANPADQEPKITWSSSDKSIATVTSSGKVTGKKVGKCTISAKLSSGKVLKCSITVKAKAEVIDVSDYLRNPTALLKKQNNSFDFKYKNGRITYACITGENATFSGLNPGEINMANLLIMEYDLVDIKKSFLSQVSYYENRLTGERIEITEVYLLITKIEYFYE